MTHLSESARCGWQDGDGLCASVLHEVFSWLEAEALCAASATCRAWRIAAAEPALWRRLLQRRARLTPARMRALTAAHVSWREEYVRSFAGWQLAKASEGEREGQDAPELGGARHMALAPDGRLALSSEDAEIAIWQLLADGSWSHRWGTSLRVHGWASAERALWPQEGSARLLVAGALALADSWELLVLQVDENGAGRVVSRTRCSAGAAGCWAGRGGEAYLSLELRLLAPRVGCTTVWLNAATQEAESEHAGVMSPLLRIYNEGGAHITMATVAEAPLASDHEIALLGDDEEDENEYLRVLLQDSPSKAAPLLLTGSGTRGVGALCVWRFSARRPEPVRALREGDLSARCARAAAAPRPDAEPVVPTEDEVRALCEEPHARLDLPAPPSGLAPHRSGRCAWVSLSDGGAWCVSLPTLRVLRRVNDERHPEPTEALLLHYVQPAISDLYFASPWGSLRGTVQVWSALSGAACDRFLAPLHRATAAATLLLPLSPTARLRPLMLVLAGTQIHVTDFDNVVVIYDSVFISVGLPSVVF